MTKSSKKILISMVLLLSVVLFQNIAINAETTTLTLSVGISETTSDTQYEKQIAVSVTYNVSATGTLNVSDVVLRVYVQKSQEILVLATTDIARTSIVNNTIYTETATLKLDEQSIAGKELVGDDTLIVYAKLYNSSVVTANLLGTKSTTLSYGDLVYEGIADTETDTEKAIRWGSYILMGIGVLVVLVVLVIAIRWVKGEVLD